MKTEKMGKTRTRYHIADNFIIDISEVTTDNPKSKSWLPTVWKKHGLISSKVCTIRVNPGEHYSTYFC